MSDHDNGEEYSIALDSTEDNHSSSEVSKKEPSAEYGIGQRETKFVVRLRRLVCLVLVISMGLVAFVTYYYLSNSERDDFEQRYHENAHKVLATLGASLDKAIAGVDAFVIDMLSYARGTEQTWPFVTIPDFEARSAKFLSLTKAIVFQEYVLVTPTTRSSWEAYSKQNGPAWAEKSIDYLKRNDLFQDQFVARNITKPQYVDVIHDYSAWGVEDPQGLPQDSPGPFLPMWQSAPLIPSTPVYNWYVV